MKRTTSSNSEPQSYIESPLRFHSPLSDAGDPPESRYVSPETSPFKLENPKTDTKFPPLPPPPPQYPPPRRQRNARAAPASASDKSPSSMVVVNRWVREEGRETATRKVGETAATVGNRRRGDEAVAMAALGFRVSEVVLCLVSFSIMAADKTKGWSGDSYDRYKEYRS
ncbi:unnamed protein product, partial [Eruca vesicaria subsp. sativa]|nr:unnamed protein product [Eruca vesicaria subsp. sativa]